MLPTRTPPAATLATVRTAPPSVVAPGAALRGRSRVRGFAPGADSAAFPPLRSARVAAVAAVVAVLLSLRVRFSLRDPGRERGRFPSTPPSSAMADESRPRRPGYSVMKERRPGLSTGTVDRDEWRVRRVPRTPSGRME